jgi:hypothetical protein
MSRSRLTLICIFDAAAKLFPANVAAETLYLSHEFLQLEVVCGYLGESGNKKQIKKSSPFQAAHEKYCG